MTKFLTYNPNTMGANAYMNMRGAGYSNQQIVAGVRGRGLHVGNLAKQMIASGPQPIWMNQYTGSEGNIGLSSYNRMIAAGYTPQQIQADQHLSGMSFGAKARDQLRTDLDAHAATQRAADDKRWEQRMAQVPTVEELVAAMPEPKIRVGQDYTTSGRTAQGMRIKKGTKFAEGGSRGTKGYFGRGAKFRGDTTPVMNIRGGGTGTQATNSLNTA